MKNTYIKQLLAAILLLCCTVASAETYSGTCGENVTWSLNTASRVLNITGLGEMTNYSSSTSVPWYDYRETITSVVIGDGVTTIGKIAFRGCSGLTSVTIPNSVTTIEDGVFGGCSSLTSVTIPNSVTSIGEYAFQYCTGLTSVTIPNSVTTIGDGTFRECTGLTSITIPNSVTTIGDDAFEDCTGLTSVTIPNSVTTIEYYAFRGCSSLTSVTIPNSVTTIGYGAFWCCTGLTSVTIPNSVTTIGNLAFSGCSGLTSITVEGGNAVYDSRENCNAIIETQTNTLIAGCKNTIIPGSVTSIGENAFYDCTGLTSIEIPNSVTTIGGSAFNGCSGLTSITIPNSVTTIEGGVFYNCTGLTSIEIPGSVTTIGDLAFSGCTGLTSITIPNSVTSIGAWAFSDCTGLTSVTIPNSVTTIGVYAFSGCDGLTSVTIPNSVTTIGESAFSYCTGLTSITIPNSVTSISEYAFYDCEGLKEIYSLAETPATINSSTFSDFSATLYVPAGAKAAYQAAPYWNYFTNIVEMTPTEEEMPTEVTITISQYGTATYCSPYALDFSEVEGLKAYTATGYNTSTGVVTLTRTKSAIESTGLFLMGEPGEYTVPVIEQANDYMLNMLVGTLEETAVNNKTDDGNYINFKYTIGAESDQPMFYQFADGSTLSAGKAYLQLPASLFPSTASKSVSIRFDEGLTTDIDEVESENNASQAVYDLFGRPVSKLEKGGIYIIDGKKVVL